MRGLSAEQFGSLLAVVKSRGMEPELDELARLNIEVGYARGVRDTLAAIGRNLADYPGLASVIEASRVVEL